MRDFFWTQCSLNRRLRLTGQGIKYLAPCEKAYFIPSLTFSDFLEGGGDGEDVPYVRPTQLTSEERKAKLANLLKKVGPVKSRQSMREEAEKVDPLCKSIIVPNKLYKAENHTYSGGF